MSKKIGVFETSCRARMNHNAIVLGRADWKGAIRGHYVLAFGAYRLCASTSRNANIKTQCLCGSQRGAETGPGSVQSRYMGIPRKCLVKVRAGGHTDFRAIPE